jgi:hypothetical protein
MDNMLRELGGLALPPGYTYCFFENRSKGYNFCLNKEILKVLRCNSLEIEGGCQFATPKNYYI